jgi:menaquinone-dependent protoporphyrinogen oxidase
MKRIARDATGDTDTGRDYEYTDWAEVAAFANDFAAFVEGRLGERPE